MHASLPRRMSWRLLLALAAATTQLPAQAGPSFAGPSVGRPAELAEFAGLGFTPNAAVSVAVVSPGGRRAVYGATIDAQGQLRWQLTPTQAGMHKVQVLTTSGKLIREAAFNVMQ